MPPSNPNITLAIQLAKEIKLLIGGKAAIRDGEKEFVDLEEGYKISEDYLPSVGKGVEKNLIDLSL